MNRQYSFSHLIRGLTGSLRDLMLTQRNISTRSILTLDLILTQRNLSVRFDSMRNSMLNQHWISIHHLLMRTPHSLVAN
jgi:hypothetical protein